MLHSNGASMFFLIVYVHMFRGLFYGSYIHPRQFFGLRSYNIIINDFNGFLGYVFPWGQMSFWAATVITNLASAVPYVGNKIVLLVMGWLCC